MFNVLNLCRKKYNHLNLFFVFLFFDTCQVAVMWDNNADLPHVNNIRGYLIVLCKSLKD